MTGRYLEEFAKGQKFASGQLKVDRERIKSFAAEFDPQPFHLNEEAARGSVFKGLAASGWHTAAMTIAGLRRKPYRPASARFDGLRSQIRGGAAWTRHRTSSLPRQR